MLFNSFFVSMTVSAIVSIGSSPTVFVHIRVKKWFNYMVNYMFKGKINVHNHPHFSNLNSTLSIKNTNG